MTDKFLVALYERKHPGVDRLYNIASGYIHFSREHVNHLLMRSKPTESGARVFHVSDEDSYLPDNYKSDLVASFATITDWLLDEVESWVEERDKHGTKAELHQRFGIVKVADVA